MLKLTTPLTEGQVRQLEVGQRVLLSGTVYTGRDAAHRRIAELLAERKELPVDLRDQVIYYVGPCPAPPGRAIGSAGPTTSGRMDRYTPLLMARCGLRGMIGKGMRAPEVIAAMREHGAVYFVAVGGAGALLAQRIKRAEVVAFPELGTEAVHRLEIEDFPVIVAVDASGRDLYVIGRERYRRGGEKCEAL